MAGEERLWYCDAMRAAGGGATECRPGIVSPVPDLIMEMLPVQPNTPTPAAQVSPGHGVSGYRLLLQYISGETPADVTLVAEDDIIAVL